MSEAAFAREPNLDAELSALARKLAAAHAELADADSIRTDAINERAFELSIAAAGTTSTPGWAKSARSPDPRRGAGQPRQVPPIEPVAEPGLAAATPVKSPGDVAILGSSGSHIPPHIYAPFVRSKRVGGGARVVEVSIVKDRLENLSRRFGCAQMSS